MGLLSKVKAVGGVIKAKASSLGAKIVNKVKERGVAKNVVSSGKLAAGVIVSAARKNPAVAIASLGVAAAGASYAIGKKLGQKSKEKKAAKAAAQQAARPSVITPSRPSTLAEKAKSFAQEHPILVAGGAALAGGVAGAVISAALQKKKKKKAAPKKRKASKRTKRRSTKRRSYARSGRRVSFTTRDGRRVSFTPHKRKAKRRGHLTEREMRNIERLIRRDIRD